MALYEDLKAVDFITPILRYLDEEVHLGLDDKLRLSSRQVKSPFNPWILTQVAPDRNCLLWYEIYLKKYRMISRNCFNCWKIVCRPSTLTQLLRLQKLQNKMGLPAKCGIERRTYVKWKGIYAGFWYAPMEGGLAGARELRDKVETEVHEHVGEDVPVMLKRACTEMENMAGPSDKWEYDLNQEMYEDLLDATWDVCSESLDAFSPILVSSTIRTWIEYGLEMGDPDAKNYVDDMNTFEITDTIAYDEDDVEITAEPAFRLFDREEYMSNDKHKKV